MSRAVIYTRVSTEEQAREGVSLDAQLARCREYAERNGLEVIGEFSDEGISGKSMKNRPDLQRALQMVTREKAVLVFYSLSRVGRSTKDLLTIAEGLRKAGAQMVSLQEQIDTTTAMGSFMFTLLSALCALERELIGERTKTALAHLKSQGRVYTKAAYGWDATAGGMLVVNPEEQDQLRQMFRWRQDGMGNRAIANRLKALGIPAKQGGEWTYGVVGKVLNAYEARLELSPVRNYRNKLTADQVRDIRTSTDSLVSQARRHGVSRHVVGHARHGKTYAHVD